MMKDQVKWLTALDKTVTKNFLKDTLKGKKGIGFVSLIVFYSLIFYFLLGDAWWSLFLGMDLIFPIYSIGILFISTFSIMHLGMNTMLRKHEIEYLLPLPMDRDLLVKQKMLKPFLIIVALSLFLTVILHLLLRGVTGYSVSSSIIFLVGLLLTNSFILLLSAYLMAYFRKIQGLKRKLFGIVLAFFIFLSLIEFFYWMIGMGGLESSAFSQMFYFFPINVFIGFIYLSGYLGARIGGDLHFFISLLYFAVANVSLFYLNWNFDYEVFEDNYEFSGANQGESLTVERPSKEQWWRKYLIPETPYSYPEFEKGTGAVVEKQLLNEVRGSGAFFLPYIFMIAAIIFTSILMGSGDISIEFPFAVVILMIGGPNIVSKINTFELKSFHITRTTPWDLSKLALYNGIPRLFYSVLCYEGWFLFTWSIGGVDDVVMFLVYALMGPVIFFLITYSTQFGFLWVSLPEDFDGDDVKIGSIWGAALYFWLSLLFSLLLHTYVSHYIENALKFIVIVPIMLLLGAGFIKLYDREWKVMTSKKRRTTLRKFFAAAVSIIIVVSLFAIFMSYMGSIPPDHDLKVDGDMTMGNQTLYFDDNLYIAEGGNLTVSNATLVFNTTADDHFGIYLDEGGSLNVSDSVFRGKDSFKVILKDRAIIRDSTFTEVWGDEGDENGEGGVEMYHDDILLDNITVENGVTNGLYVSSCSPTIRNSTIEGCGDDGLEIQGGSPVIRNSSITDNSWGVVMFDSRRPKFYDTEIKYNENEGIYCQNSHVELYGCKITHNGGYGLQLDNSEYTEEDTIIRDNSNGDIDRI